MKSKQIVGMAAWVALLFGAAAYGRFTPGHVFVSDASPKFCGNGDIFGWDRIWEIDPETGDVSLFVELRDEACGFLTGLAFTPDGAGLRASLLLKSQIVEFDSQGNMTVVLGSSDGISAPRGRNNLAYDTDGNFYVVNSGTRNIMRFPADGGTGSVFADNSDGIGGDGQLAFADDGDLYFGNTEGGWYVLRITPDGNASLFEDYGNTICPVALTADRSNHVYVGLAGTGTAEIYKYTAGGPLSKELLVNAAFGPGYAMTMSPDQSRIYVASFVDALVAVDIADGSWILVAQIEGAASASNGIAVAPEPPPPIPAVSQWGSLVMALLCLAGGSVVIRRRWACSAS